MGLVALAVAPCSQSLAATRDTESGAEEREEALTVPMEVRYHPAWLTWVASTTSCLNALGVECDTTDVAGYSGYAFMMNVPEDLCPSGPTAFDWGMLQVGVPWMGRSTLEFRGGTCGGTPEDFRATFAMVAREIEAGRPCVIWGTYVPEFGVAVGFQDDHYLVKTFKPIVNEPEPPIPYDKLDVPGGTYALAFPSAVSLPRDEADRSAVFHALEMLNHQSGHPAYRTGQAAYDVWIEALEANKADAFGNSYNAQCWAEAKRFARDFLRRLAGRNEVVAEPLGDAADAYAEAAEAMGKVAELFPFPDPERKVDDPEVWEQAVAALRTAEAAEARAAEALGEAAKRWPEAE